MYEMHFHDLISLTFNSTQPGFFIFFLVIFRASTMQLNFMLSLELLAVVESM